MAEPITLKYGAFLSYSHADTTWAKRLHRRLEAFRIESDLIGRVTSQGAIPKMLRPIFRDRDDFTAGHTLTEQTVAALDASAALIVLCSPASAKSHYVNEEVRLFKSRHPDRPVIPVIVDGSPGDAERECFPPAVRFGVTVDGVVTDRSTAMLAADVRDSGDGEHLAVAKVVARVLDLSTDDIFRRAERTRRRRARIRNSIIASLAILAIAATGSAAYAWQQLKTNEAFLEATLKRATEIVNTAVGQAEKYNVPRTATLELLSRAEGLFDDIARLGRPTPALLRQKAWMLVAFAHNYEILGDTNKQRERAEEAFHLMNPIATGNDDPLILNELGLVELERGKAFQALGDLQAAFVSFNAAASIYERLVKAQPTDGTLDGALLENLAFAYQRRAIIEDALGRQQDTIASFQAAHRITEHLAKERPNNAEWQRNLAESHQYLGSVHVLLGHLPEALKSYQATLAIMQRLVGADPNNPGWQRDLAAAYSKIGKVSLIQDDFPGALTSYQQALAITARLARTDPTNVIWQRDLWASHGLVGDVYVRRKALSEALVSYRASRAIAERLIALDPNNPRWQEDLALSHERFGKVYAAQDNLPEALKSYDAALAIRTHITAAAPDDTSSQNSLAVLYADIGDVQRRQDRLPDALNSYRTVNAIFEHFTKRGINTAHLQNSWSYVHNKIGGVLEAQDKLTEALDSYQAGLVAAKRAADSAPDRLDWQESLSDAYDNVGTLLTKQGELPKGLESLQASLAILDRLTGAAPDDTRLRRNLSLLFNKIGKALTAQGKLGDALKSYQASLALSDRLAKAGAERRDDLNVTIGRIGSLAYDFVLAGDFAQALASADQAVGLAPDLIWMHTNRAHALMFLGRVEEARAVYLRYRGVLTQGDKIWEVVIRDDFDELRAVKRTHPLMAEIERAFRSPTVR